MKIIFLNSSKKWGGNERWLTTAINGLAGRGHSVHLVKRSKVVHWNRINSNVNIIDAPFTNELSFKTKKIICDHIRKNQIELIISTKRKDYFIGGRVKKQINIPHVIRLGISRPILKRDFIQRILLKKRVDGIIVNAKKLKEELLSYPFLNKSFNNNDIVSIYNGYKIFSLKKIINNKNNSTIDIRSAGRLTRQKGYDFLIEVAKKLKKEKIKFIIKIAGDGPERKNLLKAIQDNCLNNEFFLEGEIDNVIDFFNDSDLVVIPSRSEGIPNTLFEAWQVKKPVLVTNVGGVEEVLIDNFNGIICEPRVDDIFNGIVKYIKKDRKKLIQLGINGFETLNKSFSMDIMIKKIENYLLRFIN